MKLTETITIDNLDVRIAPNVHSRLRWKEYQILSLLVENSPRAVTRDEFINHIWKGTYCSDSTINQTIKSIRKKIGDNEHKIIKTLPRIGYIIEEKQRFTINSENQDTSAEAVNQADYEGGSLTVADPQPPAVVNPVVNDLYIDPTEHGQPVWALPTHSKETGTQHEAIDTRHDIPSYSLKKFAIFLVIKLYQHKKRFLLFSMIFMVMLVSAGFLLSNEEDNVARYDKTMPEFDELNALALSSSLGYKSYVNGSIQCTGRPDKNDDAYLFCKSFDPL